MSAPNFNQTKLNKFNLPLVVFGMGNDFEQRKKDFESEYGDEYTENHYQAEIDDMECVQTNEELQEFNSGLKHFELKLESGYYQGVQYDIEETDSYNDYESIQDITDEDADYYYGLSAKEVKAEFENDLAKIREFLHEQVNSPYVIELDCMGIFSNGEAIYKEAK